ncbi:MAG: isocitrate/isopropylmalate family dehydrogenase [Ignavibacteriales bacterium]|nr:isocitrate/isopropylmalate family dehydrogenase [Ignavibacteriales bacterium]
MLDQAEARRRVHPRRHRLGVLVHGGRRLPAAHHRPAEERRRRACSAPSPPSRSRRPRPSWSPSCRARAWSTARPIVRMRQLFDLYICLRPCKAYPGNPLNYKEGIDLVVFRENTEDLYAGVEFNPVPDELARHAAEALASRSRHFADAAGRPVRHLLQDQHAARARSASSAPPSSSRASTAARRSPSSTRRTSCAPPTGCSSRSRKEVAKDFPEHRRWTTPTSTPSRMWLLKNPLNYDVLVAPNLYGDIISDLCAQMVGGLGFGCSGNIGEKLAVFEPTHGSAPKYAGQYKVNPIATILAAKMMLDWLGETEKARAARDGHGRGHQARARSAPTTWAARDTTLEMAEAIAAKL